MADKSKQFTKILEKAAPPRAAVRRGNTNSRGVHIGGYFDPTIAKQLRILAVTEEVTLTDLVAEAIDLLSRVGACPKIAREQEVKEG